MNQKELEELLKKEFNDKVKEGVQVWYNNDKGISMQNELIDLLKNAAN